MKVEHDGKAYCGLHDPERPALAKLRAQQQAAYEERVRVARIGRAAPALLAALKEIERHHAEQNAAKGRDESRSHTLKVVRAAIAKAEGIA